MKCSQTPFCRYVRALITNPQNANNWAGIANGAGIMVLMGVSILWGFGMGNPTHIAAVMPLLSQMAWGFIGTGALVVATNLGFDKLTGPMGIGASKSKNEKEEGTSQDATNEQDDNL